MDGRIWLSRPKHTVDVDTQASVLAIQVRSLDEGVPDRCRGAWFRATAT